MARYSGYMYDTMTHRYILICSSAWKWAAEDCDGSDNEKKGVWSDRHHETRQPGFVSQKSSFCNILNFFGSESPNVYARSWQEKGRPEKCFTSPDFQRWRLHRGERKVTPKVLLKHRKHIRSSKICCQYFFGIVSQDYEDFDLANEDDVLEEFLGIERENPKESCKQTDFSPGERITDVVFRWSLIKLELLPLRLGKGLWENCPRREFPS